MRSLPWGGLFSDDPEYSRTTCPFAFARKRATFVRRRMIKLPDLASLALLAPRIARSATLSVACGRIVEDLTRTMRLRCAILEKRGQSWEIVSMSPREVQIRDDRAGAIEIALGGIGGVERMLVIVGRGGEPVPDPAWVDILQKTLSDALMLVALRVDAERGRRYDLRCYRFAAELLRPRGRANLYRFLVERMARAVGAGTGSLALYVASENALSIVAAYGYPSVLVDHVRVKPGDGVLGRVFATRRAECAKVPPSTTR